MRSSLRSSIGCGVRARVPDVEREQTAPTAISAAIGQPGTMPRPIVSKPNIEADEPDARQHEALESNGGTASSRRFGDERATTSTMPSTPIGTLIQKIQRQ